MSGTLHLKDEICPAIGGRAFQDGMFADTGSRPGRHSPGHADDDIPGMVSGWWILPFAAAGLGFWILIGTMVFRWISS